MINSMMVSFFFFPFLSFFLGPKWGDGAGVGGDLRVSQISIKQENELA